MKILIVEDEFSYFKLLRDQLTDKGYQIIQAEDGKAGLAVAIDQHPDLIILDIRMPVKDGIEMLAELRNDAYGKLAKVILLTNLEPNDRILRKVLHDQPLYYLVKSDTSLAQLIKKIGEVLKDS